MSQRKGKHFRQPYTDACKWEHLGNRLRYIRLCRGWSRRKMGELLGLKRPNDTVQKYEEQGLRQYARLCRIAEVLKCEVYVTLKAKKGHPVKLDFRLLARDGRIAQRPTIKLRDEYRDLVAWSERQFPRVRYQRRRSARKKATSDKTHYYALVRAEAQKLRHEQPLSLPPSPQTPQAP